MPAVSPEQGGDATITVAAEPFSKRADRFGQRFLASPTVRLLALGRSMLTERLAGPALRYAKPFDNPVNTCPASRRA